MSNSTAQEAAEEKIRRKLDAWFRKEGRDLPWRRNRDPYAVLVSEFMLQQTTVAAVVPYYHRWMAAFPDIQALASASEPEVMALWSGLGYYSRARNLHGAARVIVERFQGRIPRSVAELRTLPGVGTYTAAAIACFSHGAREVVLDSNIIRVLARLANWRQPVDDAAGRNFLSSFAAGLLPRRGAARFNAALMDLGATVCRARRPECPECPLRENCLAESPESLPVKRPRVPIEERVERRSFVFAEGRVWLEPSPGPRWQGLWLLPPASSPAGSPCHVEVFPITRFRVTMQVFPGLPERTHWRGFVPSDLPPMPSPHRRAVAALLENPHSR